MEVFCLPDHEAASESAANLIADALRAKTTATILVATGNTPMRAYELLVGRVDATRATAFQLDEYVGVPESDERSLYGWMHRSFVAPLAIPPANVRKLDGCAADLAETGRAYDAEIERCGGIDISILGLGPNGHLGFNEPPSEPHAPTRSVALTPESLASNAAYWDQDVPNHAMTVGMKPILNARLTILMATGVRKHSILNQVLNGPISPDIPASQLRLARNPVFVVTDKAALEGI